MLENKKERSSKKKCLKQRNHIFLTLICRIHDEHFMMKTFVPYYLSQGVYISN